MNVNALARNYGRLTAEERFRLILAAGGRGDEAERDRLAQAGGRLTLSVPDHAPYGHAFEELVLLTYIELLEEAARTSTPSAAPTTLATSATPKWKRTPIRPKKGQTRNRQKAAPAHGPPGSGPSTWPWPPATCCERKPRGGSCSASG